MAPNNTWNPAFAAGPPPPPPGGRMILGRYFFGPVPLDVAEEAFRHLPGVYLVECLGPISPYAVYVGQSVNAGDRIDRHEHYLDWCQAALGPLVASFHPEPDRDRRVLVEAETRWATSPLVGI